MNYRSSACLLGLPLVHIAIGPAQGSGAVRGIAKGWIAIGDIAFGVLFAVGGVAVGGLCLGGFSFGIFAIAGLSVGVWAFGGLALGVYAMGGGAIALWAAQGGFAIAGEYALGGMAIGSNANTEAAQIYFDTSGFFRVAEMLARHSRWLLVLALMVPIVALVIRRQSGRGA